MKIKEFVICLLICTTILAAAGFASAITASIGNSRMILRIAPGETVEKSILVKNVNDVPVSINSSASGDLESNLKIKNPSFDLQPGEQREIYFSIVADKAGKTETRINIGFKPKEGNGVGLSSTIIVFADPQYVGKGPVEENKRIDNLLDKINETNEKDSVADKNYNESNSLNYKNNIINIKALIISSVFLAGILIVGYFYYLTNKSKKSVTGVNA